MLVEERDQRRRAAFFLTFKEQRQLAGQGSCDLLISPKRFDKGHQLPFVIRSPSRADLRALRTFGDMRVERIVVPEVKRINRLHVIVAVEQHVRAITIVMRHNHRMARRVAHARIEPDGSEIRTQPFRRLAAFVLVGAVGGNALHPQKFKQSRLRGVAISVEMGKNGV